jgi:predicted nucleic acid-binding protein
MSLNIYVVDTSYLIELAGCGRDSNPEAHKRVRELFKTVGKGGGRFFVPLPCLFELGDHIADIRHNEKRSQLAAWLQKTVETSLTNRVPWQITPTGDPGTILPALLERFQGLATQKGLGLVDSFIVHEAERLKASYARFKARIYIWTNDGPLKDCEPDPEPDRFLWSSDGKSRR